MNIIICIEDKNLDFKSIEEAKSFESAEEMFGKMQRRYEKRVAMELEEKDNDF